MINQFLSEKLIKGNGACEYKKGGATMRRNKRIYGVAGVIAIFLSILSSSAVADMTMTEANRPYSVRFQDWVFVYINNEFMSAAPPAPDYNISVKPKIVEGKIKFIVTGYYFDTKVGNDWYRRYGSQVETIIAMLCHSWTQQGHPTSLDDFDINIRKEKLNQ